MMDAQATETLLRWRDEKDRASAEAGQSVILTADLDRFDELRDFDADPVLWVEPFESIDLIERDASQGESATYESFGRLGFELDGTACQLTVY